MEIAFLIFFVGLIVLQILMIVKFFQISSDVRSILKEVKGGATPQSDLNTEVERLCFLKQYEKAEELLLNEKFKLLKKGTTGGYSKTDTDKRIESIDYKITQVNMQKQHN